VESAPVSTTSKYGEASLNQCEVARETPTCSLSIGRRLTGMSQTAMKVSSAIIAIPEKLHRSASSNTDRAVVSLESWARPFGSLPDSLRPRP
jgi:hypothetical protein